MNPVSASRPIHIPGVGGPFIETTDGDSIRLDLHSDFKPDPPGPIGGQIRSAVLLSLVMLSTGSILGWIGHATLIP